MQNSPLIPFPTSEQSKIKKLSALFEAWRQYLKGCQAELGEVSADEFVADGFFPYYTKQQLRIVFVGRESRDVPGQNYVDVISEAYGKKNIGGRALHRDPFHSRLLYVAYGHQEWSGETSGDAMGG